MSLQRIFESARKLGVPVIVTDPAGREPMVVLSLDHFEAMAGTVPETREIPQSSLRRGRPAGRKSGETVKSEEFSVSEAGSRAGSLAQEPSLEDMPLPDAMDQEISLDERFYLEPLEDDSNV